MGPVIINFAAQDINEAANMRQQFLSRMETLGYRSSNIEFHVAKNGKVDATLTLVKVKKKKQEQP